MKTAAFIFAFVMLYLYITAEIYIDVRADYYKRPVPTTVELNPQSLYELPEYEETSPEVKCLAENIYHEARNQGIRGMYAVAYVTINRVNSADYPDSICEVVHQPQQFSWTHQNKHVNLNNRIERTAWEVSVDVALKAIHGDVPMAMHNVLHYHANYVKPKWTAKKRRHSEIEDHIFYVAL